MTSTPYAGSAAARRSARGSASAFLVCDLERFWPSRRSYAFDELCR